MNTIRVFFQSVREYWKTGKTGVALFLISIFVLIYGYIDMDYELEQGWNGHKSIQNVLKDISTFIPVGGALVAMFIGGFDIIMLFSDWYLEKREERKERRLQAAKAEGIAAGEAKVYQEIAEWDRRRKEAEARGDQFTEPPPAPPKG